MTKAPAFQFYPSDFAMGTALFTNEEKGIYIVLLCFQWEHGRLPGDKKALCHLARCTAAKLVRVLTKFTLDDSGYFNARLEREREKQRAFRERQAQNGHKRWVPQDSQDVKLGDAKPHAKPDTNAQALAMPVREDRDRDRDLCSREGIGEGMQKDDFPAAWQRWRAYRAEKGEPLTSYTARQILQKCERMGPKKAVEAINLAIEKSWKNLFADGELQHQNGSGFGERLGVKNAMREAWQKNSEGLTWREYQERHSKAPPPKVDTRTLAEIEAERSI